MDDEETLLILKRRPCRASVQVELFDIIIMAVLARGLEYLNKEVPCFPGRMRRKRLGYLTTDFADYLRCGVISKGGALFKLMTLFIHNFKQIYYSKHLRFFVIKRRLHRLMVIAFNPGWMIFL